MTRETSASTSHRQRQQNQAVPLNVFHDEVANEVDISAILSMSDVGDDTLTDKW